MKPERHKKIQGKVTNDEDRQRGRTLRILKKKAKTSNQKKY